MYECTYVMENTQLEAFPKVRYIGRIGDGMQMDKDEYEYVYIPRYVIANWHVRIVIVYLYVCSCNK